MRLGILSVPRDTAYEKGISVLLEDHTNSLHFPQISYPN